MKKLLATLLLTLSLGAMSAQIDAFIFTRDGGGQIEIRVEMMESGYALRVNSCSFTTLEMGYVMIEDEEMIADLTAMFNEEAVYEKIEPVEGRATGTWRRLSYIDQGEEVDLGDAIIYIDGNYSSIFSDIMKLGRTFCK